jgi:hypothetical protein
MRITLILAGLLISINAHALKFDPALSSEIYRVIPIYEAGLKLSDKEFCGANVGSEFWKCQRDREKMAYELQALKNSHRMVKQNQLGVFGFSWSYFIDNDGIPHFTEDYWFKRPNEYGTAIEQAQKDIFNASRKYPRVYK